MSDTNEGPGQGSGHLADMLQQAKLHIDAALARATGSSSAATSRLPGLQGLQHMSNNTCDCSCGGGGGGGGSGCTGRVRPMDRDQGGL